MTTRRHLLEVSRRLNLACWPVLFLASAGFAQQAHKAPDAAPAPKPAPAPPARPAPQQTHQNAPVVQPAVRQPVGQVAPVLRPGGVNQPLQPQRNLPAQGTGQPAVGAGAGQQRVPLTSTGQGQMVRTPGQGSNALPATGQHEVGTPGGVVRSPGQGSYTLPATGQHQPVTAGGAVRTPGGASYVVPAGNGHGLPAMGEHGQPVGGGRIGGGSNAPVAMHSPAIPAGVRPQPLRGGGSQYTDQRGRTVVTNPHGQVTEFRDQNHIAQYDGRGQARFIQATHNGMTTTVTHGFGGQRTIQTRYADGTRVVSYGAHSGFAERAIVGRPGFVARTTSMGGITRVSVYRSYSYQNHAYYRYVPAVYYRPAFYGWVNSPWRRPVVYNWGPRPYGVYYGAYFTPYQSYPTPDLWLTDYVLNYNLQQAYAARQDVGDGGQQQGFDGPPDQNYQDQGAGVPPQQQPFDDGGNAPVGQPGPPPEGVPVAAQQTQLDPTVKALIAQQVKIDIAEMQAASAQASAGQGEAPMPPDSAMPEVLRPDHTAFEVSSDTQLYYGDNQSCVLSPGDVLYRKPDATADITGGVEVTVVGRKPGSCDVNVTAKVSLATLQDMNNQFQQQLQGGMQVLAAKAGKDSIPAAPDSGQIMVASGQAPAQDVNAMLAQNQTSGQQAETEIATAATGNQ